MVKRIYQIADIHIPQYQRLEMYTTQIQKVLQSINDDFNESGLNPEEVRIVLCGDIVDAKNQISPELLYLAGNFIRSLSGIAKTICFAGNHDLVNNSRLDTLTSIFNTVHFDNAIFIDDELEKESGILYDDDITWALYSYFDDYKKPDIKTARKEKPNNMVFGLYHGQVVGTKLFNGIVNSDGQSTDLFNGCDYVLAGHIHKRQVIKTGKCEIVYPGSMVQKDFGETVKEHGYAIWDLDKKEHKFVDIPNDYARYDFTITSIEDLEQDKEVLNNA